MCRRLKPQGQLGSHAQTPGSLHNWRGVHSHFPKSTVTGSSWSSEGQVRGQAEGVLGVFRWFNVLETGILKCPSEISCQFIFILYPKKKKKSLSHTLRIGLGRKEQRGDTAQGLIPARFARGPFTWKFVRTAAPQPRPLPYPCSQSASQSARHRGRGCT